MIYVGNNFFYTKEPACTLWFFDKGEEGELKDKVLFIDAQRYHTAVSTTLQRVDALAARRTSLRNRLALPRGDREVLCADRRLP